MPAAASAATKDESLAQFSEVCLSPEEVRIVNANDIIQNRMYWAAGVGLVPIPLVDLAGLVTVQITMIRSMAHLYGVAFNENLTRNIVVSLLGSVLPVGLAGSVGSLIKLIPVIGWTVGSLSMSISGGAATYAIGKIFLQHFEAGGTLLSFDVNAKKTDMKEKFEEGKTVVEDAKKTGAPK